MQNWKNVLYYIRCTKNSDYVIGLIIQKAFFVIDTDESLSPPTYTCIFSFHVSEGQPVPGLLHNSPGCVWGELVARAHTHTLRNSKLGQYDIHRTHTIRLNTFWPLSHYGCTENRNNDKTALRMPRFFKRDTSDCDLSGWRNILQYMDALAHYVNPSIWLCPCWCDCSPTGKPPAAVHTSKTLIQAQKRLIRLYVSICSDKNATGLQYGDVTSEWEQKRLFDLSDNLRTAVNS